MKTLIRLILIVLPITILEIMIHIERDTLTPQSASFAPNVAVRFTIYVCALALVLFSAKSYMGVLGAIILLLALPILTTPNPYMTILMRRNHRPHIAFSVCLSCFPFPFLAAI